MTGRAGVRALSVLGPTTDLGPLSAEGYGLSYRRDLNHIGLCPQRLCLSRMSGRAVIDTFVQ
jgi:hypothetical protein